MRPGVWWHNSITSSHAFPKTEETTMKKSLRLHAVALALTCALPFGLQAKEVVKIGVAGPFTGANAAFGEQLWIGATAAATAINEAGGINGKELILVKADDACEPKQAVAVANRLVDEDQEIGRASCRERV